jgi:hypothetical protein
MKLCGASRVVHCAAFSSPLMNWAMFLASRKPAPRAYAGQAVRYGTEALQAVLPRKRGNAGPSGPPTCKQASAPHATSHGPCVLVLDVGADTRRLVFLRGVSTGDQLRLSTLTLRKK